jgi:hypothetical protein
VFGGQHRIFVAVKNAVAVFPRTVFAADEPRVRLLKLVQLFGKRGFVHLVRALILQSSRGN